MSPGCQNIEKLWTPRTRQMPRLDTGTSRRGRERVRPCRCPSSPPPGLDPPSSTPPYPGPLATYAERLQHCRLSRRKYPPPAKGLSKAEEVRWRRLQTGTYNTPARLNTIHPGFCDPKCKYCGEKAGLHHMVWTCPHNPPDDPNAVPTIEGWEAALSSSGLEAQRALVTRARVAAAAAGVPD